MLDALTIIERAKPQFIQAPTAATSRDMLIRNIQRVLEDDGIEAKARDGFYLDKQEKALPKHLTPFENLISMLIEEDFKKASSFSRMVRRALDGQNNG